eukprot:4942440-Pleurochrysis_carterae.AAC.1
MGRTQTPDDKGILRNCSTLTMQSSNLVEDDEEMWQRAIERKRQSSHSCSNIVKMFGDDMKRCVCDSAQTRACARFARAGNGRVSAQ